MKITLIYNTVYAFATQRNATQRNATQRNAYQNYILSNNFKFYIFQFFRAFNFLSVFIRFAKNQFAIISHYEDEVRSNLFCVDCHDFLRSLAMTIENLFTIFNNNVASAHCVQIAKVVQGVSQRDAEAPPPCCSGYAFSCALKNQFEIISQLNYGFCYKNYFFNLNQVFRNSYDFGERFGRNLNYGFGKSYNCNFKNNCDYDFEKNCNGGFGKNYFGNCNFGFDFGNEIYGIGNNLADFLFNRKIKK